jgi:predicted alpha-1,2-mannosidase
MSPRSWSRTLRPDLAAGRPVERTRSALLAIALFCALLTSCGGQATKTGAAASNTIAYVADPSALVNPFAGTGTGGTSPGSISEYPDAVVPFGMIQWGPDTSPDRIFGSGYSYTDSHISGFSLTHLSGTGCAAYGDVPILPTVGAIGTHPLETTESFSHAHESAAPGRYSVTLGPAGIGVDLSVTTRTGLSRITFPDTSSADVLFKVADSANPVSASDVQVVGSDEVTGQVTSGQFCQTGTLYTLHFAAYFNRPFSSEGTWTTAVSPGSKRCSGTDCGAYVTFDTSTDRTVLMKVGISFVSVADAESNVAAEDPGWSLPRVESAATAQWNSILARIRIAGGTHTEQRIFYTALYHALLNPNVVSDYNGNYMGADQRVHQSPQPQYSNFSEWDIYRSEIELLSVVAPVQTGDMIQSLVNEASQDGWLPKWAIVGGDASQMNGDSADPIIASAYAFGVHNFDLQAALKYMIKGATQNETGHGFEIERQYLSEYVSQHYVNANSLDLSSINYSDGGSVTLEYALDDFAIAQFAKALGDNSVYESLMQRSHNWQYLVNPSAGYIEARNTDGSFPEGPAFQSALFEPGGELGFEEGNAIQYTWAVPQDLFALGNLIGGRSNVVTKLDTFFTHLNAGRFEPYDWAGNEPSLWSPWEYDYFGAPWETQDVVRRIVTTQYHDAPVNEPGNDDLGAISSWYVWAAMGLYPVTPGTSNLALASPLFPEISIALPDGNQLDLSAPQASASTPYVQLLTVKSPVSSELASAVSPACTTGAGSGDSPIGAGSSWQLPWLPGSVLSTGGTLYFTLSATPDKTWATNPQSAPPSYGSGELPDVGFSVPIGGATISVGRPAAVQLGIQPVSLGAPEVVWTASATGGVAVSPRSGILGSPGSAGSLGTSDVSDGAEPSCSYPAPVTQVLELTAVSASTGHAQVRISMRSTSGVPLPPVVMNLDVKR